MIRKIETVILLCFCLLLSTAMAEERRVVRVAFPEQDGMSMISQTGKVDLFGPMLKSAAVEDMFEMPENSYGTVYTTLCALTTSRLRENNIKSVKPLRVGLLEKAETLYTTYFRSADDVFAL